MSQRPNILFLLSDEHSFRYLGKLDPRTVGEPVLTPNLDALAARGTALERTYCQFPLCTPSRICMLTGMNPMTSGGWGNCFPVAADRSTIASSFTDAGYATCLVGKMHLGGRRQFAGFQHRPYGDLTGHAGHQKDPLVPHPQHADAAPMRHRTLDAGVTQIPESLLQERVIVEETVAFLREQRAKHPEQPWFLCASFSRPHFPLTAPARWFNHYWPDRVTPPKVGRTGDTVDHPMTRGAVRGFCTDQVGVEEGMRARAAYAACVSYLDEILGDLLALLERDGQLDNTIIVYTTDHGELAGEHGLWWKNTWHEAASRVPWIVQTPAQRRGEQPAASLHTPVSLADLYPTLAGLCSIARPDDLEGTDLSAAITTGVEPTRGPVFFVNGAPRWGKDTEHVAVVDGDLKYIGFRERSWDLLFDLARDPLEQTNLLQRQPDDAARLRALVDGYWDFDAAEVARRQAVDEMRLTPAIKSDGNLYVLPDGRLIGAEAWMRATEVVAEDHTDVMGKGA